MKKMSLALLVSGCLVLAGPALAGDAAAGQVMTEDCAMCHGDDGWGDEDYPPIAGIAEADFIKVMKEYQDGTLDSKDMKKQVKGLSEDDIANLAAYYATLEKMPAE
ncbi:MAG: cytochrome c [Gammaproteobacteria bacterium]|nr:cytochrome c [Gammaproteobacteria bacterium]